MSFFKRPNFGLSDYVMLIVAIAAAISWFTSDVRRFIDVQTVLIRDAVQGEPVIMNVARELYRDFDGFYIVTVRNANGGAIECITHRQDVPYRLIDPNGNPTMLPDPLTLAYWAYGGNCTRTLAEGLPVGTYVVETCHGVYNPRWWIPLRRVCWPQPAIFSVLPQSQEGPSL